ncbi:unnamed protein product [Rotaria socialis]|uniref:RRM domain-containing protein n=6 Tax=Rotaria TaxID=231623 RepID=A0A817TN72_9BILA|nr:unnamed protein product [Rotaria socialis]CAF3185767.1 unnamed protein product [Rotaria socialis]CAF3316837.1 unnamed protein product [Rotaria socialis]CAF3432896.1 unnamed protein product [Rotaria socialis]CAF4146622.1 unnamed protein product [Rotaria socialis]
MSRVIVKNLPKQVKEEQIRKHFQPFGSITDLQLKYTKDGIFRRFAFVGFINDEEAQRAIDKLNKSYIGTSKIIVEQCFALNDSNRPRPWSKYSEQIPEPIKIPEATNKPKTKSKGSSQLVDAILGDLKYDEKFKEFVKNVDSMKKSEQIIWNDSMKNTEDEKKTPSKPAENKPISSVPSLPIPVKEDKPKKPRYLIKICGIPYSSKENDIRQFFSPISIVRCRLIHNRKTNSLTGVCWIELENEDDMNKAMFKQKTVLSIKKTGENRYLELTSFIKNKELLNKSKDNNKKPMKAYEPINEAIGETGELFVRNLSYRTTEQDLDQLFSPFGRITNINMPIDSLTKQPKGFAHVTFMFPEHALGAFNQLDGHAFQGRLLHILPGKTQQQKEQDSLESTKSQTPTAIATSSEQNWNALFLSSNAIAEIMAERYSLDKSAIADSTKKNDSLAVRLAVGETQIIHETRQFLIDNGVQLDSFSQAISATKRSKNVILAKNLPIKTHAQDLRILFEKYGKLEKIILPPYGHCALIVFEHPQEARQAFKQLSYRKFKDNRPLYLEWAPGNVLSVHIKPEEKQHTESLVEEEQEQEPVIQEEEVFTLFVKNLNFDTTDEDLEKHFSSIGSCRAYVAKKKDLKRPGQLLSMGYGFVEYSSVKLLEEALKQLQNSELQGHTLELKRSERTMKSNPHAKSNKRKRQIEKEQQTSKILVKNIPFQANIKEIRELFRVFGELKFVRLPKKVDDERHRGFGFVDFISKNDAKNAFDALCHSTHLYGRRLVLEWADEENDTVEGLRRKTAAEFDLSSSGKRSKRSELLGELRKMGGNEQTSERKSNNTMADGDDDDNDE